MREMRDVWIRWKPIYVEAAVNTAVNTFAKSESVQKTARAVYDLDLKGQQYCHQM